MIKGGVRKTADTRPEACAVLRRKFPGRASAADAPGVTSFETCLRGELLTYSAGHCPERRRVGFRPASGRHLQQRPGGDPGGSGTHPDRGALLRDLRRGR